MTRIKNLSQEEQASAVNTLLLAFSSYPFQRYLMPDSSIFLKNSALWFNNAASQSISIDGLWELKTIPGLLLGFRLII